MRKTFLTVLTVSMLLITGCTVNINKDTDSSAGEDLSSEPVFEYSEMPQEVAPIIPEIEQRLGSAVKDAYAGIEIDAFIRERAAILPGFAIPVTVIVKNTGDKTIEYVVGSGSYTVPDALLIEVTGLQAVLPIDRLGPATMDFRTNELKPGEQLEFIMNFMAVDPDPEFDKHTIEMYNTGGEYIADKPWDELKDEYSGLVPAKPGQYSGKAFFMYYTESGSGLNFTTEPDGYTECDFTVTIS